VPRRVLGVDDVRPEGAKQAGEGAALEDVERQAADASDAGEGVDRDPGVLRAHVPVETRDETDRVQLDVGHSREGVEQGGERRLDAATDALEILWKRADEGYAHYR
jgi:hypothetical protein